MAQIRTSFFRSYLSNRFQYVTIKNAISRLLEVLSGVPQGSILGPLLFLIFINDLVDSIDSLVRMFGDDTMLLSIQSNIYECANHLQPSLNQFGQWAILWKLDVNASKTESLSFSGGSINIANVYLQGDQIEDKSSHKHVGLTIQNDVKWNCHIDNIIAQVESKLCILKYHLFNFSKTPNPRKMTLFALSS